MFREVDLEEISDGKLYGSNDMVRADCFGCQGVPSAAVEWRVYYTGSAGCAQTLLKSSYEPGCMVERHLELHVVDGLILPNLRMDGPQAACTFLDGEGTLCHSQFPSGICRIFPLGRYYEDRSFQYFSSRYRNAQKEQGQNKDKKNG